MPIRPSGAPAPRRPRPRPRADRACRRRPDRARGRASRSLKRPLAWIAARRALFGALPGAGARGAAAAGLHAIAGGVTVEGSARRRESGQALPLALGGCFVADRRGAGAGRDRRRGDRQGQGPAGGRPGGDLGRALDARRPAAPALAADAARTACPTRPTWRRPSTSGGRASRPIAAASGERGRPGAAAGRLSRPALLRAGPGQGDGPRPTSRSGTAAARSRPRRSPKRRRRPALGRLDAGDRQRRRLLRPARLPRRARGCGPTSPPPSTGWPPRPPRRARRSSSTPASAPTPNRRALFAAHPDPHWVAPPGHSLHRCATELDLGPESAYGWLAANAARFGFVQRYSWEPWHYGFDGRPAALLGRPANVGARRPAGGDGAARRRRRPAELRPGPLPGAAAARGRPLERLRRAARRAADGRVELQPLRGLPGRGPGHRPVHPLAPRPPTASPTPSTRSRRSTPRPT